MNMDDIVVGLFYFFMIFGFIGLVGVLEFLIDRIPVLSRLFDRLLEALDLSCDEDYDDEVESHYK